MVVAGRFQAGQKGARERVVPFLACKECDCSLRCRLLVKDHQSGSVHPGRQLSSLLADSKSLGGGLFGGELESWLVGLLDITGPLSAVELNVAVRGEVWADSTVSTVGSSAAGDSALGHGVGDHTLVGVELLALGVSLEVDEELADDLDALLWPSTLLVVELLQHGVSADSAIVPSEWYNMFVLKNVLEVGESLLQMHALNGASDFVSVLVVSSEVSNLALSG